MAGSRFPRRVYERGSEPDARFSLANERTFLAWLRTSLALVAGGVAVHTLHLEIPDHLGDAVAIGLVVLGLVATVAGWLGWMRNERALREGVPLHGAATASGITLAVIVIVIVLAVGIFIL